MFVRLLKHCNALVIGIPEGGNPGLMWGNMGTLEQISVLVVREMWGLLKGECGDFTSVQLRGDWERLIVRSIDGKMAEEKFRTEYKLLRIEKVDIFKKYSQECHFLKYHSNRSEYSGNLKNVVFRSSNEPSLVCFPLFFISPDRFKNRIWGIQDGTKC